MENVSMILQTKITNNVDTERNLAWAGKNGVSVGAGETIVLDGAYPSECHTPKKREMFEYEWEHGFISVVIITDMSVSRKKQDNTIKDNVKMVKEGEKTLASEKDIKERTTPLDQRDPYMFDRDPKAKRDNQNTIPLSKENTHDPFTNKQQNDNTTVVRGQTNNLNSTFERV